ncbi:DinB family protein [uncultured Alistipes sp.]|jgi:hypothetical protein|uniref:DinB family protein n=1 Tax=uncultured Alistipes sp. TaxID=538949 RepID=UPI0025D47A48|nr:DinB family protein [uncultured Alistipes sp.]
MSEFNLLEITSRIRHQVETGERFFGSLDNEVISSKFNSQNRSIKQIVGHMIDSASNNLHRIVHLQYGQNPLVFPNYATNGNNDRWIAIQNYQQEDWSQLVQLWKYSNLHIAYVMDQVDANKLDRVWTAAPGQEVSLKEMIRDYPRHLQLHIEEVYGLCRS